MLLWSDSDEIHSAARLQTSVLAHGLQAWLFFRNTVIKASKHIHTFMIYIYIYTLVSCRKDCVWILSHGIQVAIYNGALFNVTCMCPLHPSRCSMWSLTHPWPILPCNRTFTHFVHQSSSMGSSIWHVLFILHLVLSGGGGGHNIGRVYAANMKSPPPRLPSPPSPRPPPGGM